jgi:hypothetical protein
MQPQDDHMNVTTQYSLHVTRGAFTYGYHVLDLQQTTMHATAQHKHITEVDKV